MILSEMDESKADHNGVLNRYDNSYQGMSR